MDDICIVTDPTDMSEGTIPPMKKLESCPEKEEEDLMNQPICLPTAAADLKTPDVCQSQIKEQDEEFYDHRYEELFNKEAKKYTLSLEDRRPPYEAYLLSLEEIKMEELPEEGISPSSIFESPLIEEPTYPQRNLISAAGDYSPLTMEYELPSEQLEKRRPLPEAKQPGGENCLYCGDRNHIIRDCPKFYSKEPSPEEEALRSMLVLFQRPSSH